MLPSLAELMGLVVMSLLIAAGMASLLRTRAGSDEPYWRPVGDALLPLFALGLLILPYLPWLADWIPAMRVLAGPGRLLIWMIVVGQVLWIFLPRLGGRLGLRSREQSRARAGLVFACTAVFLSTPFVFNVRALPTAFGDIQRIVRDLPSARWSAVPSASAAVLFDQEFGILPYAPVLVLGFLGLGAMMRQTSAATCRRAAGRVAVPDCAGSDRRSLVETIGRARPAARFDASASCDANRMDVREVATAVSVSCSGTVVVAREHGHHAHRGAG